MDEGDIMKSVMLQPGPFVNPRAGARKFSSHMKVGLFNEFVTCSLYLAYKTDLFIKYENALSDVDARTRCLCVSF